MSETHSLTCSLTFRAPRHLLAPNGYIVITEDVNMHETCHWPYRQLGTINLAAWVNINVYIYMYMSAYMNHMYM